jgi:hypothetical protein
MNQKQHKRDRSSFVITMKLICKINVSVQTFLYGGYLMLGLHGDILEIRVALSIHSRSISTVYTSTDFEI